MKHSAERPKPPGGKGRPAPSKRKLASTAVPPRSRAPSGDARGGSAQRRKKGRW